MVQKVAFTSEQNLDQAVEDLVRQMRSANENYNLILFFPSVSYDFELLSKKLANAFPNSEVVGCSTSGEISAHGFTKQSIVMTGLSCNKTSVKGVIVEDADKFPMVYKKHIEEAMRKCGISQNSETSHKDAFAITFINGLCNAEEALLAVLYAVIGNLNFKVLGGSAGDDLKFDRTFVSLNGKVTSRGGVVVFVKSEKKFTIVKENIFKPSGVTLKLTNVDTKQRKIFEINGQSAASSYAKAVGTTVDKVMDVSLLHPIGRAFGEQIFISSIAGVNADQSFNMYCRVLGNTSVELMEQGDVKAIMNQTVSKIKSEIPNAGFVFFINCILRTLQFDTSDYGKYMTDLYRDNFKNFCGFSSYGEQINRVNSNQTLVVLAMEE